MGNIENRTLYLKITAQTEFLPVAVSFVEKASEIFGLDRQESLHLALATEEIFMYLATQICNGASIEMEVFNGFYYIRVDFKYHTTEIHTAVLNVTPPQPTDAISDMEDMGLIIATRFVDKLNLVRSHGKVNIFITKDKVYPQSLKEKTERPGSSESLIVEEPDIETLKLFAGMVKQYPASSYKPAFFKYPGKVADMVMSGEYKSLIALNKKREICGGIMFSQMNDKIVEFHGPFVFSSEGEREAGTMLLQQCMNRLARTKIIGLMTFSGLPQWLQDNFESPGFFWFYRKNKQVVKEPVFYRLLHEDPGAIVWSHPEMHAYLTGEYERLVLARDIRVVHNLGEHRANRSIFSVEFFMEKSFAVIRPMLIGADMENSIKRRIHAIRNESIPNIFLELDLGIPSHAQLMGVIASQGFAPRVILPFAGKSDLLIFQYHETES